jgi:hypothetical protein
MYFGICAHALGGRFIAAPAFLRLVGEPLRWRLR